MATMNNKIGIYTIPSTGPIKHYVLMDGRLRYWTGDGWAHDEGRAKVYEAILDAHNDWQALVLAEYKGTGTRVFEATVHIEAHGDEDFSLEELQSYLENSTHFSQDTDRCGTGPVDTLVLQRADYTTLKEVASERRASQD
jgi:hypothetical protein